MTAAEEKKATSTTSCECPKRRGKEVIVITIETCCKKKCHQKPRGALGTQGVDQPEAARVPEHKSEPVPASSPELLEPVPSETVRTSSPELVPASSLDVISGPSSLGPVPAASVPFESVPSEPIPVEQVPSERVPESHPELVHASPSEQAPSLEPVPLRSVSSVREQEKEGDGHHSEEEQFIPSSDESGLIMTPLSEIATAQHKSKLFVLPILVERYHGPGCAMEISVLEKHDPTCMYKKEDVDGRSPADRVGSYDCIGRMVFRTCNPTELQSESSGSQDISGAFTGISPTEVAKIGSGEKVHHSKPTHPVKSDPVPSLPPPSNSAHLHPTRPPSGQPAHPQSTQPSQLSPVHSPSRQASHLSPTHSPPRQPSHLAPAHSPPTQPSQLSPAHSPTTQSSQLQHAHSPTGSVRFPPGQP